MYWAVTSSCSLEIVLLGDGLAFCGFVWLSSNDATSFFYTEVHTYEATVDYLRLHKGFADV